MKEEDKNILYKLFRDHEDVLGSSRLAMLALRSFAKSIASLRCSAQEIKNLIDELCEAIKNTEPRIVPLIHLIKDFETQMQKHYADDLQTIKNEAVRILKQKHNQLESNIGKVIEHGTSVVENGDTLLVHTASSDVINMLVMSREVFRKEFKVIVLKQDFLKTKLLIKTLSGAKIELCVVPEYSLSHYVDKADKLFIGAVSITHDSKIVAAIGTANIVSLCHLKNVPIYLFANSLKFSRHPSYNQRIHSKTITKTHDDVQYVLTTYSHDIVDLDLIDYLINEQGKIKVK